MNVIRGHSLSVDVLDSPQTTTTTVATSVDGIWAMWDYLIALKVGCENELAEKPQYVGALQLLLILGGVVMVFLMWRLFRNSFLKARDKDD